MLVVEQYRSRMSPNHCVAGDHPKILRKERRQRDEKIEGEQDLTSSSDESNTRTFEEFPAAYRRASAGMDYCDYIMVVPLVTVTEAITRIGAE